MGEFYYTLYSPYMHSKGHPFRSSLVPYYLHPWIPQDIILSAISSSSTGG